MIVLISFLHKWNRYVFVKFRIQSLQENSFFPSWIDEMCPIKGRFCKRPSLAYYLCDLVPSWTLGFFKDLIVFSSSLWFHRGAGMEGHSITPHLKKGGHLYFYIVSLPNIGGHVPPFPVLALLFHEQIFHHVFSHFNGTVYFQEPNVSQ